MKFIVTISLSFFLLLNYSQGQSSTSFWVSMHSGYHFTENEFTNSWIDNFWNLELPGEDLKHFKGNIAFTLNLGGSPISKLPKLGFRIGFDFWNTVNYSIKSLPEIGFIPPVDFALHLTERHLIPNIGVNYIFESKSNFKIKPGILFLLDIGELSVFSQGLQGTWTENESKETVYWKGNNSGTSFFLETCYYLSPSFELSLLLRQFIFNPKILNSSNEDSILTVENHQSGYDNSSFGVLLGIKYNVLK